MKNDIEFFVKFLKNLGIVNIEKIIEQDTEIVIKYQILMRYDISKWNNQDEELFHKNFVFNLNKIL